MQERVRARLVLKKQEEKLKNVYFLEDSVKAIEDLVSKVHKFGTPKLRVKATLYQVYHHALHNKIEEAKDLLMKTHMSHVIHLQHIDNQINYNRALTQIGLAFFRTGRIQEAHEILIEVCSHIRFKELLA